MRTQRTKGIVLFLIIFSLLFSACAAPVAEAPTIEAPAETAPPEPTAEPVQEIVAEYLEADLESYEVQAKASENPYQLNYQQQVRRELYHQTNYGTYDLASPFACIDPFRTSQLAMLLAFDDVEGYASYKILSPYGNEEYSKSFKDGGVNTSYELEIFGLFPNVQNEIVVSIHDEQDNLLKEAYYTIDVPAITLGAEKDALLADLNNPVDLSIVRKVGEASDGLFAMIGCINKVIANQGVFFYDNNGYLRGAIYTDYRANNLTMVEDGFVYANNGKEVVHTSMIGETRAIYGTANHTIHHDVILDNNGDIIMLTTNDDDEPNKEDWVIKIDKETGEIVYEIDFKEFFGDMGEYYLRNNGDWMHLNSIDYIDRKGGNIIVSSREMAGIFSFTGFDAQALELEFVINEGQNAQTFGIEDVNLAPVGDVTYNLGQHSVRFIAGEDDDHFQIVYYNNFSADNNWRTSDDFPDKDIIDYYTEIPEAGTFSYATLLNINTADMTFELEDKIELLHARRRSSAQKYLDNFVVASTDVGQVFELDGDFNIILQFKLSGEKNGVYRCYKFDIYGE